MLTYANQILTTEKNKKKMFLLLGVVTNNNRASHEKLEISHVTEQVRISSQTVKHTHIYLILVRKIYRKKKENIRISANASTSMQILSFSNIDAPRNPIFYSFKTAENTSCR